MAATGCKYSSFGRRAQVLVLLCLVPLVYGMSLFHGFVWDDNIYFINNPIYQEFNLHAIFFSLANGVEYLPLRDLTYALDYLVWGSNPVGFHLTNLIFYTGNVLLAYYLGQLITKRLYAVSGRVGSRLIPFFAAAGFSLHPINAEVVNFVTCRNVLVSGLFFFCACICFIRFFEDESSAAFKWYLISILSFMGAMLGKATAIMLPLLLLAMLPLLFPRQLRRLALSLAPFFVVSLVFFIIFRNIAERAGFTGLHSFEMTSGLIEGKIALALQIPFFYLKKLLFPYGFSAEYVPDFEPRILSVKVILAFAAVTAGACAVYRLRRSKPEFALCACWFIAALVPVLNFFGTHPIVADRYVYLPAYGFMLATAFVLDSVSPHRLKVIVHMALCIILAVLTVVRSRDWQSDETLWRANIRNFPNDMKSYVNLAHYYYDKGEHQKALNFLSENNKVPQLTLYYYFFKGKLLFEQNNFVEAKKVFRYTVDNMVSGFIGAHYFLGLIAEKEGDLMSAAISYNKALASEEPDGFQLLSDVRARLKNIKKVWLDQYIANISRDVTSNPGNLAARRELALALDQLGLYNEALEQYLVLEHKGITSWQIYFNIANCYLNLKRYGDAARFYEKVISLGGVSEDAYNNLGISYRKLEKYEKSIKVLEQAVKLFPSAAFPAFNLAITYQAAGQKEKALTSFNELNGRFPDLEDMIRPYILQLSSAQE